MHSQAQNMRLSSGPPSVHGYVGDAESARSFRMLPQRLTLLPVTRARPLSVRSLQVGNANAGRLACQASVLKQSFVDFIPEPQAAEFQDVAARDMLRRVESVNIPTRDYAVDTTYVAPTTKQPDVSPILLLPGFDCSCLEYRRLKPILDPHTETWAVDPLGNGFCVPDLKGRSDALLGPAQRRDHLYSFWKTKISRPVTLVGVSLGGSVAIDFALKHPESVERLVLLCPQVLADGIGPMSKLPNFAAHIGVKVLQAFWLRQIAVKMAFYDKEKFATPDAVKIGRIHTFHPGWQDAMVAFMRSGGYKVSQDLPNVQHETTLAWGTADEVLNLEEGQEVASKLPNSRFKILADCGHSMHLEKPKQVADIILESIWRKNSSN